MAPRQVLGSRAPGGYAAGMFGFINVNKPPGPTSFAAVAAVKRLVGRKTKVGHAGTLDPFARGVLVICMGGATRLASYVQAAPKRYLASVTLGATSTTDDVEGRITADPQAEPPDADTVRQAVMEFVGAIDQVPPAFSAVHVQGQRAYQLARNGNAPRLQARPVTIHAIDVVRYAYPLLELDVRCGSGTYIRSLARDIGAAVGTGGYCTSLTRTEVGPFTLAGAAALHEVDPTRDIVSPLVALGHMPTITLDEAQVARIATGRALAREELPTHSAREADEIALVDADGNLLAVAKPSSDRSVIKPVKVFVPR